MTDISNPYFMKPMNRPCCGCSAFTRPCLGAAHVRHTGAKNRAVQTCGAALEKSSNRQVSDNRSENDPLMPVTAGLVVADSHPFSDARFSCREVKRLLRIPLDRSIAAQMD